MARKVRRGQFHDNHERWLISYADFITLLFGFFVVMYAISSVNEGKYKVFSAALTSAFSNKLTRAENAQPVNQDAALLKYLVERRDTARLAELQRKQQEFMQNIAKNLNRVMQPLIKSGQVSVTQSNRGVVLDINASALFKQGDATVQPEAIKTLSDVAEILRDGDQSIEVDGYTDDTPIKNALYPSNWELSSARACSVVRLFIERGVVSGRLTAVGLADNHPVVPNDSAENRAKNRRVTVTILAPVAEREPAAQQSE